MKRKKINLNFSAGLDCIRNFSNITIWQIVLTIYWKPIPVSKLVINSMDHPKTISDLTNADIVVSRISIFRTLSVIWTLRSLPNHPLALASSSIFHENQ